MNMNPWISHVKHYAKQHNVSYKEALKKAKSSYRSVKGGSLKSANDWYWQKNRDLFNYTYGPMSAMAMKLYGY